MCGELDTSGQGWVEAQRGIGKKMDDSVQAEQRHMWQQHMQRLQPCCQVVKSQLAEVPPPPLSTKEASLWAAFPRQPLWQTSSHRRILRSQTWGNHCLQWPVRAILAQECYDSIFPVILCRKLHQTQARAAWTFCLDDHSPLALACHSGWRGSSQVTKVTLGATVTPGLESGTSGLPCLIH